VAETTVKKLLCCGFQQAGKVMKRVYHFWWRMCQEIHVFSSFEYHAFYVLYPFVTCILTLPRTCDKVVEIWIPGLSLIVIAKLFVHLFY
jgi:hypothetical protein